MGVASSFDESVEAAVSAGALDAKAHGAAIEAARKLAEMMDGPEWPMVNGKLDNVSPGVFLKYCSALGLTPSEIPAKQEPRKETKMAAFRSSSKFARASNG